MMYTDEDLAIATQIAYCDFSKADIDAITKGKKPTIKKLLNKDINADCINDLKNKIKDNEYKEGTIEYNQLQGQIDILEDLKANKGGRGDWKLVNIGDDKITGFYGCTIETGEGEAIVSLRGSESDNAIEVIQDWLLADVGLLNAILTLQQISAQGYMDTVKQKAIDNDYTELAVTGHSLGGNLALHSVVTAPYDLQEIIVQATSFDGPGYSDEYMELHDTDIEKVKGKLKHIHYSPLGYLLLELPGAENLDARIVAPGEQEGKLSAFQRHGIPFLLAGMEDGQAVKIDGDIDGLSKNAKTLSSTIELGTNKYGLQGALQDILSLIISGIEPTKDKGGKKISGTGDAKPHGKGAAAAGVDSSVPITGTVGIDYARMDTLFSDLLKASSGITKDIVKPLEAISNSLSSLEVSSVDISDIDSLVNLMKEEASYYAAHRAKLKECYKDFKDNESDFVNALTMKGQ